MRIILPDKSTRSLSEGPMVIETILRRLDLNPAEYIVTMNGKLVPDDTIACIGDEIRIIRVAHGG